jgi:hypothetical protein
VEEAGIPKVHRPGDVAASTIGHYTNGNDNGNGWRAMLKDDNILGGAMPTITSLDTILQTENSDPSVFRCVVTGVSILRERGGGVPKKMCIYFDAQGSDRVGYPLLSIIIQKKEGREKKLGCQAQKFKSFLKEEKNNHYQGRLTFGLYPFKNAAAGKYYFVFAGSSTVHSFYKVIPMFEIAEEHNDDFLAGFSQTTGCTYALDAQLAETTKLLSPVSNEPK